MLATLALKRRWQHRRAGVPADALYQQRRCGALFRDTSSGVLSSPSWPASSLGRCDAFEVASELCQVGDAKRLPMFSRWHGFVTGWCRLRAVGMGRFWQSVQLPVVVAARAWARVTLMPTVSDGAADLAMVPLTLARNLMPWPAPVGTTVDACGDVAVVRTVERPPEQLFADSFQPALHASMVKVAVDGVPVAVYVAAVRLIVPVFPTVKNCGGYDGCPLVPVLGNGRTSATVP